jgi:hypothetical protein
MRPVVVCLPLVVLAIGISAPARGDSALAQHAYLKGMSVGTSDNFGKTVAVSGDTLVVGSPGEDSTLPGINGGGGHQSGAVFVFVRDGGGWRLQAHLKASNSGASDEFGWSVAISGDTLVVGAHDEDGSNDSLGASGAAYVFVREGTTWSEQAYLKASNAEVSDRFGYAVAVSGETVVVTSRGESSDATGVNGDEANNNAQASGAAYVFVRDGTAWSQQAYLKSSRNQAGQQFGVSVGVSGDSVVVGAYGEDGYTGAVYVFVRDGTTWLQQARLRSSNPGQLDQFGAALVIAGDTLVVGAAGEDGGGTDAGAAYVFVRDGGEWEQQALLTASNSSRFDSFGSSVAIAGDQMVIGASSEDSAAVGVHSAGEDDGGAPDAGAAYLFVRDGTGWSQTAYLKASNTGERDGFGSSVGIAADTVIVGAPRESSRATGINGNGLDNTMRWSGAAYVFGLEVSTLGQITSITRTPGGLQLTMPAAPGRRIGIEYSPDLTPGSWIELGNFFDQGQEVMFIDPDLLRRTRPAGFYRAFLRPLLP